MKRCDLLLVNARIHTMEREGERAAAMAVHDGRIEALYPQDPAPGTVRRAREVLDLGGRAVLPGLIDGHMHFLPASVLRETAVIVAEFGPDGLKTDLAAVREKVRREAVRFRGRKPVFCFGYHIEASAEKRMPDRRELDEWLSGRELIVLSLDGHSSAYSTAALSRLGLRQKAPDGVLTGTAHELSMGKVNALMASVVDLSMLAHGIQGTVNEALEQGLVCLHCLEGFEDSRTDPSLWLLSRCGGTLPVDLRLYVQYRDPARLDRYRRFLKNPRIGGCYGWAMDGSVSSGTAAFDDPYLYDPQNRGRLYFDAEQARTLVGRADAAGFQATSHAIGTRAIETLLSAYEQVLDGKGNPLRHRIDHFEFPTRDQVRRAVALGLPIVAQPGFSWLDEKYIGGYRRKLTLEQFGRQIPLRNIVESGGLIVGSSDYPAGLLSPWVGIQGMLEYPLERERLGLHQALRTYTWNAAWATGEEGRRGSLAAGKKADFLVMEEDPFTMPPSEIRNARVRETWIDGRRAPPMAVPAAAFWARALLGPRKKI